MSEIKIIPIKIDKAPDAKGVWKNVTDVVDFQISASQEINRVLLELNKALPNISTPFNDEQLKLSIKELDDKLNLIKKSIPVAYDDNHIIAAIEKVKKNIPEAYDDLAVNDEIDKLKEIITLQNNETSELKKAMASMQKEIRSNRKEAGYKIDVVEQKINIFTEIK
jgi:predicted  nucleic acid-binding Zn-ribbon protein